MGKSNNYLIDNFQNASKWAVRSGNWSAKNGIFSSNFSVAIAEAKDFSAKDFVLECDVMVKNRYDGGISFRSVDGEIGYFISIRPTERAISLYRLAPNTATLNEQAATIRANEWQHLKIIMVSDEVSVYLDDMRQPVLKHKDSSFQEGKIFLRSFYNETSYRNIKMYEIQGANSETLDSVIATNWVPWAGNIPAVANEHICLSDNFIQIALMNSGNYRNFILEADILVGNTGDAGFMFRTSDPIKEDGYYVGFYNHVGEMKCKLIKLAQNASVADDDIKFTPNKFHHIKIMCYENNLSIYFEDMLRPVIIHHGDDYAAGKIGIRSYYNNVQYDNIKILPLRPKLVQKVQVICYDAYLSTKGQLLHEYYEFVKPWQLSYETVNRLLRATNNEVFYHIVDYRLIDTFETRKDGKKSSELEYLRRNPKGQKSLLVDPNDPEVNGNGFAFDYRHFVDTFNLVDRVNKGGIDEVWIQGDAEGGFAETMMVGKTAYFINGYPEIYQNSTRNFAIVANGYGRPDVLLHVLGHMFDFIMQRQFNGVFRLGYERISDIPPNLTYSMLNDWEKFLLCDYSKDIYLADPQSAVIGCGNTHHAPNTDKSYLKNIQENDGKIEFPGENDPSGMPNNLYTHKDPNYINSNYLFWRNYKKPGYSEYATESINSEIWGKTDDNFQEWWLSCIPRSEGSTNGVLNNWWYYLQLKEGI